MLEYPLPIPEKVSAKLFASNSNHSSFLHCRAILYIVRAFILRSSVALTFDEIRLVFPSPWCLWTPLGLWLHPSHLCLYRHLASPLCLCVFSHKNTSHWMQGSWQTENDFISRASINSVCKTLIQVRSHSDVLGGCALRGTLFNPAKLPRGNAEAGKTDSPETKRERLQDWATEDACSMYTTDSKASRSDPQKRRKCLSRGQRNQERVVSEAHKGDGLKQMRRDPQRREGGRLVFNGERVSFLWWKAFWRRMVARGAPQDERMWCHWNVHFETLKMVNVMHIFPQQKKIQ